jgi:cytochrome c
LIAPAQVLIENNHAPVIKIDKPKTSETLNWNTLVPYTINVNDVEDGNSAYEEIVDQEVLLLVKYLENSSLVDGYLSRIDRDLVPLVTMSQSTCLNCHAATTKLIGPSFDLVAKRYSTKDNAKRYLLESVIIGSTGIWGEEQMPPHPDITEEEAGLIIDWILNQEDSPTQFYVGLEGAIRIPEAQSDSDKGVYVLTAAYKDHGSTSSQKNKELGLQTITLKTRQ